VADNPKTPPTGTAAVPPPRPIPTLATVQTTVEVLVGQIKGLRLDTERLGKLIAAPPPDVLRISTPPNSTSAAPPPRPSMAAKAAKGGGWLGKAVLIASGVLTVAGQIVAVWKPEYTGPIIQALRLLGSLGGGGVE